MATMIDLAAVLAEWPEDANPSWRKLVLLLPRYIDKDLQCALSHIVPGELDYQVYWGKFTVEVPDVPTPDIPAEVWMLRQKYDGRFVQSIDEIRGGECYLCVLSEREAKILADTQNDDFIDLDCEPVRVK